LYDWPTKILRVQDEDKDIREEERDNIMVQQAKEKNKAIQHMVYNKQPEKNRSVSTAPMPNRHTSNNHFTKKERKNNRTLINILRDSQ